MTAATDDQAQFDVTCCCGADRRRLAVQPPERRQQRAADHTSIIATIAAKENLPALTYRDTQANTPLDYLSLTAAPYFLTPPTLAEPATPAALGGSQCVATAPPDTITPSVTKKLNARTSEDLYGSWLRVPAEL